MTSVIHGLLTRPWALQTFKFSHVFCSYKKHLVCRPKHGWFQTIFVKLTENIVTSQSPINAPLLVSLEKFTAPSVHRKAAEYFLKSAGSVQVLINTETTSRLFFLFPPIFPPLEFILSPQEVTWWSHMKILSSKLWVPFLTWCAVIMLCSFLL